MPGLLLALLIISAASLDAADSTTISTITIFDRADIRFSQTEPQTPAAPNLRVEENGRVIVTTADLPMMPASVRITGHLLVEPIAKDELEVYDRWDRAGSIRLSIANMPDIELLKFITAYGGRTEWTVDLSHLAPVLQGTCTFRGFVDTWVSPAWKVSFSLAFAPADKDSQVTPAWVRGLFFQESATRENMGDTGLTVPVTVPAGLHRILLYYFVSGHCTDGRDADEFVPRDNVISVDRTAVYRFRPWRDDCRQFRAINPYTRRWSDGTWSSDYSRSGWCPGDWVRPVILDLTDHFAPGPHTVNVRIENIRPKDKDGNYGYWRISGYMIGYPAPEDSSLR